MNIGTVEKYFSRYPKLQNFICAGTVSLKSAREILLIDRFEMYNIYLDLLEAQAITAASGSCMRATPELKAYVAELRAKEIQEG